MIKPRFVWVQFKYPNGSFSEWVPASEETVEDPVKDYVTYQSVGCDEIIYPKDVEVGPEIHLPDELK